MSRIRSTVLLVLLLCCCRSPADYFVGPSFNGPVVIVRVEDSAVGTSDNHIPASGVLVQRGSPFHVTTIRVYRATVPPTEIKGIQTEGFDVVQGSCHYGGVRFYIGDPISNARSKELENTTDHIRETLCTRTGPESESPNRQ